MVQLKPEEAVEMLRENGMVISKEEAVLLLEFLRKLANIIVTQYLEQDARATDYT